MKQLRDQFELKAKDTIGYAEAGNKTSFMTGYYVAFIHMSEHYNKEISELNQRLKYFKDMCAKYEDELKTVAGIIKRYQ